MLAEAASPASLSPCFKAFLVEAYRSKADGLYSFELWNTTSKGEVYAKIHGPKLQDLLSRQWQYSAILSVPSLGLLIRHNPCVGLAHHDLFAIETGSGNHNICQGFENARARTYQVLFARSGVGGAQLCWLIK